MRKFFDSVYFTLIVAAIFAFFGVMQEVWLGSPAPFINLFAFGAIAGFIVSALIEGIKTLVFRHGFSWKNVGIATVGAMVVAAVTFLLFV